MVSQAIAVRLRHFLDDAVRSKDSEQATGLGGEAAALFGCAGGVRGEEELGDVAISKSDCGKLATGDVLEEGDIVRVVQAHGPNSSGALEDWVRDLVEDFGTGSGVSNSRQRIEVGVVGSLRELGTAVKVSNAFAER